MTEQVVEQYYAMCRYWHVLEVQHNTDLEDRCKERAEKHPERISALVLDSVDCPGCYAEARKHRSFYLEAVVDWEFCPVHDQHGYLCKDTCAHQRDYPIERAPSEGAHLWQSRLLPQD